VEKGVKLLFRGVEAGLTFLGKKILMPLFLDVLIPVIKTVGRTLKSVITFTWSKIVWLLETTARVV